MYKSYIRCQEYALCHARLICTLNHAFDEYTLHHTFDE